MTPKQRFEEKVGRPTSKGCWPWIGARLTTNYGAFRLGGKTVPANRAAYMIYRGEIPKGMYVCHTCDDRGCVNPKHLWLGTPRENVIDMVKKGRCKITRLTGSRHPQAKLKEADIPKIKKLKSRGMTERKIAKLFEVSQRTIWGVLHRQVWHS